MGLYTCTIRVHGPRSKAAACTALGHRRDVFVCNCGERGWGEVRDGVAVVDDDGALASCFSGIGRGRLRAMRLPGRSSRKEARRPVWKGRKG